MRRHHLFISLLSILLLSTTVQSCFTFKSRNKKENSYHLVDGQFFHVTRVIDGDTFVIDNGTPKGAKVRLIGVDAPESRRTGKKEIGYYGKEAKEFVTKLLTDKKVKLEYDVNMYDIYLRILAYVYLEDGTFLNDYLVKHGYAKVMTVPPNEKYSELFVKSQQEARVKSRGLWGKAFTP